MGAPGTLGREDGTERDLLPLKGRNTTQFSQLCLPPTPHLNWLKGATFGAFREKLIDRNVTLSGGELIQPPRLGWLTQSWVKMQPEPQHGSCSGKRGAVHQRTGGGNQTLPELLPCPMSAATRVFWRSPAFQGDIFGQEPVGGLLPAQDAAVSGGTGQRERCRRKLASGQAFCSNSLLSRS